MEANNQTHLDGSKYTLSLKSSDGIVDTSKLTLASLGVAHRLLISSLQSDENEGGDEDLTQKLIDLIPLSVGEAIISQTNELEGFDVDSFLKKLSTQVALAEIKVRENKLYKGMPTFENIYVATLHLLTLDNTQSITVLNRAAKPAFKGDKLELDLTIDAQVIISGDIWSFDNLSHASYIRKINNIIVSNVDELADSIYALLVVVLVYEKTKQRLQHRLKIGEESEIISNMARQIELVIPVSHEDAVLYAVDFYIFKESQGASVSANDGLVAIKNVLTSEVGCTDVQAEKVARVFFNEAQRPS